MPLNPRWAMPLLLLLTLAGGAWKMARTESITEDTAVFVAYARQLGEGPLRAMQSHDQHPGFPALLYLVQEVFGPVLADEPGWRWVRAGQVVSLLASLALTLAVVSLVRQLAGPVAALTAGFLVAIGPTLTALRADALSDTLALALLLGSASAVVRAVRCRSRRAAFLCGALAGLGYLVRPEAAQVAIVGGLMLLVTSRRHWMDAASSVTCLAAPILLLTLPYIALRGTPFTKSTRALLAQPIEPPSDIQFAQQAAAPVPTPSPAPRAILETCVGRDSVVGLSLRGGWRLLQGWVYNLGLIAVVAIVTGLWIERRHYLVDPATQVILALLALNLVLLPTVLFGRKLYLDHRHVLALSLLALPWAWAGLQWWAKRCRVNPAFLVLLVAALGIPRLLAPLHAERRGFRDAAEWLADHAHSTTRLFDATRLVSCLAGQGDRNRWPDCAPAPTRETFAILEGQFRRDDLLIVSDRYVRGDELARWGAGRYHCVEVARFDQTPGAADPACVCIYSIRKEASP